MTPDPRRETAFADIVDRVLAWPHDEGRFTDAAFALSSGTRLAVLDALVHAGDAGLHIHEAARRVGVDASPARQHLELLAKTGLATEGPRGVGRERRFATRITGIKLILEGVDRPRPPKPPTDARSQKALRKIDAKIEDVKKEMMKLRSELAKLEKERARVEAPAE